MPASDLSSLFREHGALILELPDAMQDEPITPEMIDGDDRLTDAEKARIYDMLFEYHGDEGDDDGDDFELYDVA